MRKLLEKIIDYPFAVILFILSLTLVGIYVVFNRISVEREPNLVIPYIVVSVPYPGATPSEVETKITTKIEDKLKGLDDVDFIQSTSYEGLSVTVLKFLSSDNVDKTKRQVSDYIDLVKPDFPEESEEPIIQGLTFDETAVLLVTVTSNIQPTNLHLLKKTAENIKQILEAVAGVSEIILYGGLDKEIHVEVNPLLAKAYGLSITDVANAIKTAHLDFPVGTVESQNKSLLIKTSGKFDDLTKLSKLKIKCRPTQNFREKVFKTNLAPTLSPLNPPGNGTYDVPLSKIATINASHKKITSFSRFNSLPAVTLIVKRKSEINVLKTVEILKQRVNTIRETLPDSISISTMHDSSSDIKMMLKQLGSSALYGAMLVLILLIFALGFRNAILVGFTIPFTLIFSATLLFVFNYSINTMTIFSMIVILGMVIDGAIIVAENIYRHIEEGKSSIEAAKKGIAEVGPAVFVADMTTICAFLPIAFLSGITGEYMKLLPITVILTLIGSMLIDHFGLPVIGSKLMKPLPIDAKTMLITLKSLTQKLTAKMRLPSTKFRLRIRDIANRKFSSADTEKIKLKENLLEPPLNQEDLFLVTGNEIEPFDISMFDSENDDPTDDFKRLLLKKLKHSETTKVDIQKPVSASQTFDNSHNMNSEPAKDAAGVRRWKLDYKSILDASEDLKNAILEEINHEETFGENEQKAGIFKTENHVVDNFIHEIIEAKEQQEKGAITSFWRKGEEPIEKKKKKIGFEDDGRIIIPEKIKYETQELLLDQKDLGIDIKKKDTAKREKDQLIQGASPMIKFLRLKYEIAITFLIKFRYFLFVLVLIAAALGFATIFSGNIPVEYMPRIDKSKFFIQVKMPVGTPLKKTSKVLKKIENELVKIITEQEKRGIMPEIKSFVSTAGNTNALIADVREYSESGPSYGKIQVELIDSEKRKRSQAEIIRDLRDKIPQIVDAQITVDEVYEGPPSGFDVALKIQGEDFAEISQAMIIIKELLKETPGTKDILTDYEIAYPELKIKINKKKATKYKIQTMQIARVLRVGLYGEESGAFEFRDEETKIYTKLTDSSTRNINRLKQLYVRNNDNILVPISEVIDFSFNNVPVQLKRYNFKRTISVNCKLEQGFQATNIENQIKQKISQNPALQELIPSKISYKFVGETQERDRSFNELGIALIVAICLILFVLAIFFNSIRMSLVVLINVPLGFIGAIFGLYVTNNSFNVLSFIGVIALMGIVVNDAIVLVDYIREARNKGFSLKNSIIKAGQTRLRPVLLTSITTIAGLLPLTLNWAGGGEMWHSLCVAIVFGIAFATILTLIVLPLFYYELFRKSAGKSQEPIAY